MFFIGKQGGHTLVDRGDPISYDYSKNNLTKNSNWHTLDLSGVVPAGAIGVLLFIEYEVNTAGMAIYFRKTGNTQFSNVLKSNVLVANQKACFSGIVFCDGSRNIDYWISTSTWSSLNIIIRGWIKE